MERIYKLIVNQEDLTEAENKLENEGVDHVEFIDFSEDHEELGKKPMHEISDNVLLVVVDEPTLGRLVSFMLQGGVKTTKISDVTKKVFYGKIEYKGENKKFAKAVERCLMYNFGEDDVFAKMKNLGGPSCLTETDKRIIEKSSLK